MPTVVDDASASSCEGACVSSVHRGTFPRQHDGMPKGRTTLAARNSGAAGVWVQQRTNRDVRASAWTGRPASRARKSTQRSRLWQQQQVQQQGQQRQQQQGPQQQQRQQGQQHGRSDVRQFEESRVSATPPPQVSSLMLGIECAFRDIQDCTALLHHMVQVLAAEQSKGGGHAPHSEGPGLEQKSPLVISSALKLTRPSEHALAPRLSLQVGISSSKPTGASAPARAVVAPSPARASASAGVSVSARAGALASSAASAGASVSRVAWGSASAQAGA